MPSQIFTYEELQILLRALQDAAPATADTDELMKKIRRYLNREK